MLNCEAAMCIDCRTEWRLSQFLGQTKGDARKCVREKTIKLKRGKNVRESLVNARFGGNWRTKYLFSRETNLEWARPDIVASTSRKHWRPSPPLCLSFCFLLPIFYLCISWKRSSTFVWAPESLERKKNVCIFGKQQKQKEELKAFCAFLKR